MLQLYLECLSQEIRRLLSSYKTFSTNYSWTLSRGRSQLEAKRVWSGYSTVSDPGQPWSKEWEEINVSIKTLSEVLVCENRLLLKKRLKECGVTQSEADARKNEQYTLIALYIKNAVVRAGARIISEHIDGPFISVTYGMIKTVGRPDIVLLAWSPAGAFVVNVECVKYESAPMLVGLQQTLYAIGLYRTFGFPILPVLVVDAPLSFKIYVLRKHDCWDKWLRTILDRAQAILKEKSDPRLPRSSVFCDSCEPRVRGSCHARV